MNPNGLNSKRIKKLFLRDNLVYSIINITFALLFKRIQTLSDGFHFFKQGAYNHARQIFIKNHERDEVAS
jgi:hypothetical protein